MNKKVFLTFLIATLLVMTLVVGVSADILYDVTSTTYQYYRPNGIDVDIIVEDIGDSIKWTFDFPIDSDPGNGNMGYGLVISFDQVHPAFQIHNNDGTCNAFPWGTHLYSPWDPLMGGWNGWHTGDPAWNTEVEDIIGIDATGHRYSQGKPDDPTPNPDGIFTVTISKEFLENEGGGSGEIYWAAHFGAGGFYEYGGLSKYPEEWRPWSGDASTFEGPIDFGAPDTNITYLTHADLITDPHYCEAWDSLYVTWADYDNMIVTHGISSDASLGDSNILNVQYGWDMSILPWDNAEADDLLFDEITETWHTQQQQPNWFTPGHHRVCGRAIDSAGNQENIGINDVWNVPNDDCCDVCIDKGEENAPISKKEVGYDETPVYGEDDFFVTDETLFALTCEDWCAYNEDAGYEIPGSGLDYIEYKIQYDEEEWPEEWTTYIEPFHLGEEDGIYHVIWRCVDNAGNIEVTHWQEHKLDNEVPKTTKEVDEPKKLYEHEYTSYENQSWYVTSNTNFTLTCEDEESGCGLTYYRYIGGCQNNPPEIKKEPEIYNEPFRIFGLSDGEFTLEYWSEDNLGNGEEHIFECDYIDNTGPEIEILQPLDEETWLGCGSNLVSVEAEIINGGVDVDPSTVYVQLWRVGEGEEDDELLEEVLMTYHEGTDTWRADVNHWNYLAGTNYYIKVVASDYVGNEESDQVDVTLAFDVYFKWEDTSMTFVKGETAQMNVDVKLCHGGNAIGMKMTKLCGGNWLNPRLSDGERTYHVNQISYFKFIDYLFGSEWKFMNLTNNRSEVGKEANLLLQMDIPENIEIGDALECLYLYYKFGAAYDYSDSLIQLWTLSFPWHGIGRFEVSNHIGTEEEPGTLTFTKGNYIPPMRWCGDNSCNNGETCETCPEDCGTCPVSNPQTTSSGGGGGGGGGSSGTAEGTTPTFLEENPFMEEETTTEQETEDDNAGITGGVIGNLLKKNLFPIIAGVLAALIIATLIVAVAKKKSKKKEK